MPPLTGTSQPIRLSEGYSLQAPGLRGNVNVYTGDEAQDHATRGEGGLYEENLLTAFRNSDMYLQRTFEIDVTADERPTTPGAATRADGLTATTRFGEPAMILTMQPLDQGVDYAVLYTDEAGISRWIFPQESAAEVASGQHNITFHLPREGAPEPPTADDGDADATRGPLTKLGRRVVRTIAWYTDGIVGVAAQAVADTWENKHRPYGFLSVAQNKIAGEPNWEQLRSGRSLLLLHGTFSASQIAFHGLAQSSHFQALSDLYGGRIFAFNHPSLHHSPTDNIQQLFNMLEGRLPADATLEVDLVTHSRGGLVGRVLNERAAEIHRHQRSISVNKAIFVAAPHGGTILADGKNWFDLIDRYTNLLTNLPDNLWTISIEALLALVRLIGRGALGGLPGLRAMLPDGDYLGWLNSAAQHPATYYAIGANFVPSDPNLLASLRRKAVDAVVDHIFGGSENDGVVPTLGSYQMSGSATGFPIPEARRRVFTLDAQVHHTNYFMTDAVNQQIVTWLAA